MQEVVIRKYGNIIDVSPDGQSPLPQQYVDLLSADMTYVHKETLHGAAAFDPVTGERRAVRLESRKLYVVEQGRLTCGAGYLARVCRRFEALGIRPRFIDVSPPLKRPEAYVPHWDHVRQHIKFRPRQEECLQAIAQAYGGIVKAVTGFGKTTLIAAHALLYPQAKIHVVIRQVDVVERAVRGLTKYLPAVGQVGGGRRQWGRVTVITADSLHHADGDCDWLFADEVHQLMAGSYSEKIAERYRFCRMLGLSATPYARLDGAHARLEPLFGPTIFELNYPEAVQLGLVVPIRVRWIPVRLHNNPAKDKTGVPRKRWGIWRNDGRHAEIAAAARSYPNDTQVLILVETVEQAVHLWRHLPEFELCYGEMNMADFNAYVQSGLLPTNFIHMTPERRTAMRAAFEANQLKKVIATDVWATGVDFEQLSVVIRADARDSEILDTQGPGRASRIYTAPDGTQKQYGEVVDFMDNFDKALNTKARSRFRSYRELGWEQDWPTGRRNISLPESAPRN